jgi:hypothetical protein
MALAIPLISMILGFGVSYVLYGKNNSLPVLPPALKLEIEQGRPLREIVKPVSPHGDSHDLLMLELQRQPRLRPIKVKRVLQPAHYQDDLAIALSKRRKIIDGEEPVDKINIPDM